MPKNSQPTIAEDSPYLIDEIGPDAKIETAIEVLGDPSVQSPLLKKNYPCFVSDQDRVLVRISHESLKKIFKEGSEPLSFELAGPRQKIYFDPTKVRSAIVTCGGLCPGINDVIRAIVLALHYGYGAQSVLGIRYGLRGFIPEYGLPLMDLTLQAVNRIHEYGGTILASSRGHQPIDAIVDALVRMNVSILFIIGGDGTFRAGVKIADEIKKRDLKIAVSIF